MIETSWSRHMTDEANRGAQPMHRNRRQPPAIAFLSLASLVAALALAWVQNVELDRQSDVADGIAQMGIEGEGDIPLPVAEQT
jgi:hypothetical protein